MSMRMTRREYERLVAENIAWLKTMPRTLERDHILTILDEAVRYEYDSDYARGVADERARVVADLRRKANIVSALSKAFAVSTARALRDRADRYERGGHESESVTTAVVKSDDR